MQKSGSRSRHVKRAVARMQALAAGRGDLPGVRVAGVRAGCWPRSRADRRSRRRPPRQDATAATLDTVTVTAQKRTREPAEGADQHPGAGRAEARRAQRHRLRRLREVPAERLLPDASARASRRSTCAAWPAAATATTPARCPASACTSTSSRSPPSRARSTSTSTTSPASRRWPARRARCTAPARRPARCASSPTSPTRAASRPATTSRSTRVERRRHRLRRAKASSTSRSPTTPAIRLVGWNQHDAGYIDNVAIAAIARR